MESIQEKYYRCLKDACNEMKLDYLPQAEAGDLLYKVITLEDIYLPLSLNAQNFPLRRNDEVLQDQISVDWLIQRIEARIAELEAKEAQNKEQQKKEATKAPGDKVEASESDEEIIQRPQLQGSIDTFQGERILIKATPGSGKTTLCKRLTLALIDHDESFFEKYEKENDLRFDQSSLPILVNCKHIATLSEAEYSCSDFPTILYKLSVLSTGSHLTEISADDFSDMFTSSSPDNITIILDGWDEILDSDKEQMFCQSINDYLEVQPNACFVITIRPGFPEPALVLPYTGKYAIRPLSDDDIREFCKKWSNIIFHNNPEQAKMITTLSEQFLCSNEPQVKTMMRNPLDLSLLLAVSRNEGQLPENKAELFRDIVELYIFWNKKKYPGSLKAKTIRILLAYTACYFTKHNLSSCSEKKFIEIISYAISDLMWAFSEDVSRIDPLTISRELSHIGIFLNYNGRFSFSGSSNGAHRQMQEYLTALAIVSQYSDAEYNKMSPIDIFEDKYNLKTWDEVILFVGLMNNGRLRHEIVKRLINKTETDPINQGSYTNLLFDLIVYEADLHPEDKHEICDVVFSTSITEQQIDNIFLLLSSQSRNASDFTLYIDKKYKESLNVNGEEYGYAKAIIEASNALINHISPLEYADQLMQSGDEEKLTTGALIIGVLAWCENVKILNVFSSASAKYKMTDNCIKAFQQCISNQMHKTTFLSTIRDAILANYVEFEQVFDNARITDIISHITSENCSGECELVLSMIPVFSTPKWNSVPIDGKVKEKYKQKLDDEIEKRECGELAFSFNICAALNCFTEEEQSKKWDKVYEIYTAARNDESIGKAWFNRLLSDKDLQTKRAIDDVVKTHTQITDLEIMLIKSAWVLEEQNSISAVYEANQVYVTIDFPNNGISDDVKYVLDRIAEPSINRSNNLAYLLRRKQLLSITVSTTPPTVLRPEQLLSLGVLMGEPFSILNYALCIANIYGNNTGSYSAGKDFVNLSKDTLRKNEEILGNAISWWGKLGIKEGEYEGYVVLSWLYSLGLLRINGFTRPALTRCAQGISQFEACNEDFKQFHNAIENYLSSSHSLKTDIDA